jgi:ABC-type transport system substrate-binding protein
MSLLLWRGREGRSERGTWRLGGGAGLLFGAVLWLAGCGIESSPNPPGSEGSNTLFTSFDESSPKYFDPTSSYSTNETPFTYSVYEAPYRYNYLKRPYALEGRAAESVVAPRYYDRDGKELPADAPGELVAESVYDIKIRPGILYAPHPALARSADGQLFYHNLKPADLKGKFQITDFKVTGTRELIADDFVYAIKRIATPRVKSPTFSVMEQYIIGLKELAASLREEDDRLRHGLAATTSDLPFLDLRKFPLPGAQALDAHTLRIRLHGKYPQFKYWLAMSFFSPIPWEAEAFYAQPGMAERNFSLNYWPAGTGPFMMTEYEENRRHVMVRNPNFRGEPYPCEGEPADRAAGLLADCGKMMPFVDKVVFTIEKERIPAENKFVQGFYDEPDEIHPDWGVRLGSEARDSVAKAREFQEKGISFSRGIEPQNWYIGFNWLDPVVGKGATPLEQIRHRKLRQALEIAVRWEEFSDIFETQGKAGPPAMGPVPPGVFGFRSALEGMNPIAYEWKDGRAERRSLDEAKKLLAEAGYPGGRNEKTGEPLVLNYDYQRIPTPEYRAEIEWVVKQFASIGVQLEIRATDYNRFQDKMNRGSEQIFWWGWNADYPDAENFLFLLYGPNSKALTHGNGENAANYQNDEFDRLFEKMKYLDDGPEKQALIDRMVKIVREDSPWLWGYNPYSAVVTHDWMTNAKATQIVGDKMEYRRIDPKRRLVELEQWNKPIFWPLWLIGAALVLSIVPAWRGFRARERASALPGPSGGRGAAGELALGIASSSGSAPRA